MTKEADAIFLDLPELQKLLELQPQLDLFCFQPLLIKNLYSVFFES